MISDPKASGFWWNARKVTVRNAIVHWIFLGLFLVLPSSSIAQESIPKEIVDRLHSLAEKLEKEGASQKSLNQVRQFLRRAPNPRMKQQAIDILIKKVKNPNLKKALGNLEKKSTKKKTGYVLTNIKVFDGEAKVGRLCSVFVEGNRISKITEGEPKEIPSDFERVDMEGHFLTPGFIDAHVHLATNPSSQKLEGVKKELRKMLGSGITGVRDMGGDGRALAYYARQTKVGDLPGPDIYYSTILAGPRFFSDRRVRAASKGVELGTAPWAYRVTKDTDLKSLIQRVKGIGSTGVKLYFDIDKDLTERIAKEAKAAGLKVWSHWKITPSTALETIQANVEVVSHADMAVARTRGKKKEQMKLTELIQSNNVDLVLRRMREKNAILDSTLAVYDLRDGSPRMQNNGFSSVQIGAEVTRQAFLAGVRIAAGSDSNGANEVCGGHREYRLLHKKAKLGVMDVLNSATVVNAEVVGRQDALGKIRAGKEATFLVFDSDPSKSIESWEKPKLVIKRGVIYSGSNLRDTQQEPKSVSVRKLKVLMQKQAK